MGKNERIKIVHDFLEQNYGKQFAYLHGKPYECNYLFVRNKGPLDNPFVAIFKIAGLIKKEKITPDMRPHKKVRKSLIPLISDYFTDYHTATEEKAFLISKASIVDINNNNVTNLHDEPLKAFNEMTWAKMKIEDKSLINLIKSWNKDSLSHNITSTESNRGLIEELDKKYSHTPEFEEKVVKQIQRPSDLRTAILYTRGTKCQLCKYPGFAKKDGNTYAETHHMIELNKQATRTLQSWNILVLCPTCHKKMHYAEVRYEPFGKGWKVILEGEEHIM